MLFTSYQFILFVLIALILYYVVPKRIQWIVLLCMNMLFYVYAGLSGIIFIVTTYHNDVCRCKAYMQGERQVCTLHRGT